jgi:hypothetical protein
MSFAVQFKSNNCVETMFGPFETLETANNFIKKQTGNLIDGYVSESKLTFNCEFASRVVTTIKDNTGNVICEYNIFKLLSA